MSTAVAPVPATAIDPVVVDLGKKSRKQIRNLKRGKGKLLYDVAAAVEEVKASLGAEAAGKEFVPVVIVYRKKDRRGGRGGGWLPFMP